MQRMTLVVLFTIVLMLTMTAAAQAQNDAAQPAQPAAGAMAGQQQQGDYQKFSGTWQLVAAVVDGKPVSAEEARQTILITDGDKFRFQQADQVGTAPSGTFTINPATDPKQVDSTASTGSNAGQVSKGIYAVEGDSQVAVFAKPGSPRPTDFTAAAGSGRTLQIWQRVQPGQAQMQPQPAGAAVAGAQQQQQPQDVARISHQIDQAILRNDMTAYRRLVSPQWTLIGPQGQIHDRQQAIQQMQSGDLKYQSIQRSDENIRTMGDTAIETARLTVTGTRNGQDISGQYAVTNVWQKQPDGTWQAIASQMTPVVQGAEAGQAGFRQGTQMQPGQSDPDGSQTPDQRSPQETPNDAHPQ